MNVEDFESVRIRKAIKRVALNHTRKMSDAEIESWEDTLRPYAGPVLMRVLEDFALASDFPNVGEIRAKYFASTQTAKVPKPLTEAMRKRADHAAIVSMLWLHYEHHWPLERFGGELLTRVFSDLMGPGMTPAEMLHEAKKHYTQDKTRELFEAIERSTSTD